jgi:hypothetical protein
MAHPARNATVNPLLETPPSWSLDLSQHGAAEKCHFWERRDRGRSGVIYKWGGTDDCEGASVSKDIGCRYGGSGWTRRCKRARGCSQPEAVKT